MGGDVGETVSGQLQATGVCGDGEIALLQITVLAIEQREPRSPIGEEEGLDLGPEGVHGGGADDMVDERIGEGGVDPEHHMGVQLEVLGIGVEQRRVLDEEGDTSAPLCAEPPSSTGLTSWIDTESRCMSRVISTTPSSSPLNLVVFVALWLEPSKFPLFGIDVAVLSCGLLELSESVTTVPASISGISIFIYLSGQFLLVSAERTAIKLLPFSAKQTHRTCISCSIHK